MKRRVQQQAIALVLAYGLVGCADSHPQHEPVIAYEPVPRADHYEDEEYSEDGGEDLIMAEPAPAEPLYDTEVDAYAPMDDAMAADAVMDEAAGYGAPVPYAAPPPAATYAPPMHTPQPYRQQQEASNRERYRALDQADFKEVKTKPLSTFSVDVDTAGYALVRRHLQYGSLPADGAVRIEEMINYFKYEYEDTNSKHPFSAHTAVTTAPWQKEHKLVRVAVKAKDVPADKVPAANLVFLIDVSGSMEDRNKLPLLKRSLKLVAERLRAEDSVGIVVYAGSSGVVLEPTNDQEDIITALDELDAGGSTNGAAGIEAAYQLAESHFKKEGINRVILATDGDFNVGVTSESSLTDLVAKKAKSGVYLTILGFGMGNYNDGTMEMIAGQGNGNYAYIDNYREAKKVLAEQLTGTMMTVAKDVKIQVEFNPAHVKAYRLIGYENRRLKAEDFNNDKKDAGDVGAGHQVTALYEVVPTTANTAEATTAKVDPLRYASLAQPANQHSSELMTVKLRYKQPDGDTSTLISQQVTNQATSWSETDQSMIFATAVAMFGMKLRQSPVVSHISYEQIRQLARQGMADRDNQRRSELLELIRKAEQLDKRS